MQFLKDQFSLFVHFQIQLKEKQETNCTCANANNKKLGLLRNKWTPLVNFKQLNEI